MPRQKSVILTPTEKKAAVEQAKAAVKEAKAALSEANKARKVIDSEYAKNCKLSDKEIKAANAQLTNAEAALLKLTGAKPTASPTE